MKNTIWNLLTFVLNSTVFLFLGIELHQLVFPLIADPLYSTTSFIHGFTFNHWSFCPSLFPVGCLLSLCVSASQSKLFCLLERYLVTNFCWLQRYRQHCHCPLLPRTVDIPHSLIIFLCAAVTALSFLTGLFVLPLIAAKKLSKLTTW